MSKYTETTKHTRLTQLMGERDLSLAIRAARRLRCENEGGHEWMTAGAEKGNTLIQKCAKCGGERKIVI